MDQKRKTELYNDIKKYTDDKDIDIDSTELCKYMLGLTKEEFNEFENDVTILIDTDNSPELLELIG